MLEMEVKPPAVESIPESFVELHVLRTVDGIRIKIKSSQMETWVKSICRFPNIKEDSKEWVRSDVEGWKKQNYYPLSTIKFLQDYQLHQIGKELYFQQIGPNLGFFTARGLKDGVVFELPGVYSESIIKKWCEDTKQRLVTLYKEYMKKVEMVMNISITEVE